MRSIPRREVWHLSRQFQLRCCGRRQQQLAKPDCPTVILVVREPALMTDLLNNPLFVCKFTVTG